MACGDWIFTFVYHTLFPENCLCIRSKYCTFIPCIQTVPVVQKAVAIADEIQTIHDFEFRHGGIVDSDVPMSKPNHAKT